MKDKDLEILNNLLIQWFSENIIKYELTLPEIENLKKKEDKKKLKNKKPEDYFKYGRKEIINWNTNKTGRIIKDNLKEINRWRGAPRGNPGKGMEMRNNNDF
jgi:hypothetical protein